MHPTTHARTPPARGKAAATLAVTLALALAAAGCGSNDDDAADSNGSAQAAGGSDQTQIKATYTQLNQSLRNKDYQQACDLMTKAMQKQNAGPGQDCATTFETLFATNKPSKNPLTLTRIKINGNKAKASATSKDLLAAQPIELTKQNNTWLISGPLSK